MFLVLLHELVDLFVQRQVKYMYSYLNINVFTRIAMESRILFSRLLCNVINNLTLLDISFHDLILCALYTNKTQ